MYSWCYQLLCMMVDFGFSIQCYENTLLNLCMHSLIVMGPYTVLLNQSKLVCQDLVGQLYFHAKIVKHEYHLAY